MPNAGGTRTKSKRTAKPRRPRGSVTTSDILDGAFELAGEVSLAGLNMPALASHLDVGVTSIYWHFKNKEGLLDAMIERASAQYHFNSPFVGDGPWRDALRNHFRNMRKVFRDNPVLIDLVLLRTAQFTAQAMESTVTNLEQVVKIMVRDGFTAVDALDIYMALSHHVWGMVVLEHLDSGPRADGRNTIINQHDTPLLFDLSMQGHTTNDVTDAHFEFTLEAILDRAQLLLEGAAPAPAEQAQPAAIPSEVVFVNGYPSI